MEDLLDSYPDFDLKYIPQGLESLGKAVNFIVGNTESLFLHQIFDVATYFQTYHVQSKALWSAITKMNQEVYTDRRWSENAENSNY